MKKINLVNIKVDSLSEIFQSMDVKIAYVNRKYEEVSVPAKCRDFLGDCIYSRKTKQSVGIYGFHYNYQDKPYDDCRFSLKFPDDASRANFVKNLSYLHEKEKQAGVRLSEIMETQHDNTVVIEGSNWWISTIWKVSLYTFYLKVMCYPSLANLKSPENSYITYLTPEKEAKMLSKVKTRKEFLPDSTGSAHNYMGFVSTIKNDYPPVTAQNHNYVFGA